MGDQLSIFGLLDEYETPMIPPEEQKTGMKGWIIEFSGTFLRENGFKEDWHGVETRPIVFKCNTHRTKYGWEQGADFTKGPGGGWYGGYREVFRSRPTWNDCLKFAREHKKRNDPEEVRYYGQTANFDPIYSYEEGY